jgi:anti-anti-sigma factor
MMPGTDSRAPSLDVTVERRAGWVVARLSGELTFATCDELAGALAGQDTGRVAVDASGLDFFDSAGIRCPLLEGRRVRGGGGEFAVVDAGRLLRRAAWLGLDGVLPVAAALPA